MGAFRLTAVLTGTRPSVLDTAEPCFDFSVAMFEPSAFNKSTRTTFFPALGAVIRVPAESIDATLTVLGTDILFDSIISVVVITVSSVTFQLESRNCL